jgi:hypothetical protein
METLSQTPPELARHLQYRYLSCRWWFYVAGLDKRISKKQTYLFTLQKILYAVVRGTGMLKTFEI